MIMVDSMLSVSQEDLGWRGVEAFSPGTIRLC